LNYGAKNEAAKLNIFYQKSIAGFLG